MTITATTWAQLATLLVVLAVPGTLAWHAPGQRVRWPSFWAWVYSAVYVLSWLLANSFWLIYYDVIAADNAYVLAIKLYTLHFSILVVIYALIHFYVIAVPVIPVLAIDPTWLRDPHPRMWFARAPITVTWARTPEHDLQARVVFVIVLAAETFAIWEYARCKLQEPAAVFVAKTLGQIPPEYVCQSMIGWAAPFLIPLLTAGVAIATNIYFAARRPPPPAGRRPWTGS